MKPSLTDARSAAASLRRAAGAPLNEPRDAPGYRLVRLSEIVGASPLQLRASFDPDADEQDRSLLESLASDGQRLPVLLLENPNSLPPAYTPLDGHRRIEALRRLKHEWVQAVIHSSGSLECDLITLTANVRKHLTAAGAGAGHRPAARAPHLNARGDCAAGRAFDSLPDRAAGATGDRPGPPTGAGTGASTRQDGAGARPGAARAAAASGRDRRGSARHRSRCKALGEPDHGER